MSFAAAQATYVLHSRPYKETSALVDFFTPLGRLRAVLRGARGKAGALARPFVPLEAEWRGRGELKTVARLESAGIPNLLNGQALFSGLYLNEAVDPPVAGGRPAAGNFRPLRRDPAAAGGGRHRTAAARSNGACWSNWAMVSLSMSTSMGARSSRRRCTSFARGRPGAGGAAATRAVPGLRTVIHGRRRLERPGALAAASA